MDSQPIAVRRLAHQCIEYLAVFSAQEQSLLVIATQGDVIETAWNMQTQPT